MPPLLMRLVTTVGILQFAACDGSTEPVLGPPASMAVVTGADQHGVVSTALPEALGVRITDANGNALEGVSVQWLVDTENAATTNGTAASGDGSPQLGTVDPAISTTDSEGIARTSWTLGSQSGEQAVTASAAQLNAGFIAMAAPGAPSEITRLTADSLLSPVGMTVPEPLRVRVMDPFGNVVPDVAVNWRVVSGGGAVDPATGFTNGDGIAETRWTLGSDPGENVVRVSVAGLEGPQFTATGYNPILEIRVRWELVDDIQDSLGSDPGVITHVGLRVVSASGEVSTHAFHRADGDEVHATAEWSLAGATVYLAAVLSTASPRAIQLAVSERLPMEPPAITSLSMDDFGWVSASWKVREDFQEAYEEGSIDSSKDAEQEQLPILVRDPFQIGLRPQYQDLWIGINGRVGLGDNVDGWREFFVIAANDEIGVEHESAHEFIPYLKSTPFGLPDGQYRVLPRGTFTVRWR